MNRFELQIYDHELVNQQQLIQFLDHNPGDVEICTQREGPSLWHVGVMEVLDAHCRRTHRNTNTITIVTPNDQEDTTPYARSAAGNCWWQYCRLSYARAPSLKERRHINQRHRRFACLIGRKNPERLAMLYWLRTMDCRLSSMHDHKFRPELQRMETARGWVDDHDDLCQWIHAIEIPPMDHYTVQDQYTQVGPEHEDFGRAHMSVLKYYHNFDIEIVAETWCNGDTFFPTEKTIRPLLDGKPFIMYGASHWLANLRNLGFRTWADCWDESYDAYEGLARWRRIKRLITELNVMDPVEFDHVMQKALEIARHNQAQAQKIKE